MSNTKNVCGNGNERPLADYAYKWDCAVSSISRWRSDGAPLHDDEAMAKWLNFRKHIPEGTRKVLQENVKPMFPDEEFHAWISQLDTTRSFICVLLERHEPDGWKKMTEELSALTPMVDRLYEAGEKLCD